MLYAIAYDIGTTGVKTCLFAIDKEVTLLAGEYGSYDLYILPGGGAEQDAEAWWDAMCKSTVFPLSPIIRALSSIWNAPAS